MRTGSNPADWFSFSPPYAHTILIREKLFGGRVKIIRRQNIYLGRAQLHQKFEKKFPEKSHSAQNTLSHILIHYQKHNPNTMRKLS